MTWTFAYILHAYTWISDKRKESLEWAREKSWKKIISENKSEKNSICFVSFNVFTGIQRISFHTISFLETSREITSRTGNGIFIS